MSAGGLDRAAAFARLSRRARQAERALAEAALRDMAAHVPVRSGALRDSGRVDGRAVVFDAPYARAIYRRAPWLEAARARHLEEWVRVAQRAFDAGDG